MKKIDEKTQARLDVLLSKNNEGPLTAAEHAEITVIMEEGHRLTIENARELLSLPIHVRAAFLRG